MICLTFHTSRRTRSLSVSQAATREALAPSVACFFSYPLSTRARALSLRLSLDCMNLWLKESLQRQRLLASLNCMCAVASPNRNSHPHPRAPPSDEVQRVQRASVQVPLISLDSLIRSPFLDQRWQEKERKGLHQVT